MLKINAAGVEVSQLLALNMTQVLKTLDISHNASSKLFVKLCHEGFLLKMCGLRVSWWPCGEDAFHVTETCWFDSSQATPPFLPLHFLPASLLYPI